MFFFFPFALPVFCLIAIYLIAALLPGYLLLRYVWKKDRVEKESPALLGLLLKGGLFAAIVSLVLEGVGMAVLILNLSLDPQSPVGVLLTAFLVVAAVEEGGKFFFLKRYTWYNQEFDHLFDGVVYAAFVSMGFAMVENVKYVFVSGLSVALPRAVLSVPAHLGFSVFMGIFYGLAKKADVQGRKGLQKLLLCLSWLLSTLLHGFYDGCLMQGTVESMLLFWLFVIAMYVIVISLLRFTSDHDQSLWG